MRYSTAIGATSSSTCTSCGAGKYSDAGSSSCTSCDAGKYSSAGSGSSSCTSAASSCTRCAGTLALGLRCARVAMRQVFCRRRVFVVHEVCDAAEGAKSLKTALALRRRALGARCEVLHRSRVALGVVRAGTGVGSSSCTRWRRCRYSTATSSSTCTSW